MRRTRSSAPARRHMRFGLCGWFALSLIGTVVVILPDQGARVLSLSNDHGPSASDSIGVIVLLVGWLCLLVPLLRARRLVPKPRLVLMAFCAGLVVTAWSVLLDAGLWWILGVTLAAGVKVAAASAVSWPRQSEFERAAG